MNVSPPLLSMDRGLGGLSSRLSDIYGPGLIQMVLEPQGLDWGIRVENSHKHTQKETYQWLQKEGGCGNIPPRSHLPTEKGPGDTRVAGRSPAAD